MSDRQARAEQAYLSLASISCPENPAVAGTFCRKCTIDAMAKFADAEAQAAAQEQREADVRRIREGCWHLPSGQAIPCVECGNVADRLEGTPLVGEPREGR